MWDYRIQKITFDTKNMNVDLGFIDIKGANCWTIDKLIVSIENKPSSMVNTMSSSYFVNPFLKS